MFLWRNVENYPSIIVKYPPYLVFWGPRGHSFLSRWPPGYPIQIVQANRKADTMGGCGECMQTDPLPRFCHALYTFNGGLPTHYRNMRTRQQVQLWINKAKDITSLTPLCVSLARDRSQKLVKRHICGRTYNLCYFTDLWNDRLRL